MDKKPVISKYLFYMFFSTAVMAGILGYMISTRGTANPIDYMLELSGYKSKDDQNQKKMQELSEANQQQKDYLSDTQEAVDKQRQQAQDQQRINQQLQEEQMQKIRSMQNR